MPSTRDREPVDHAVDGHSDGPSIAQASRSWIEAVSSSPKTSPAMVPAYTAPRAGEASPLSFSRKPRPPWDPPETPPDILDSMRSLFPDSVTFSEEELRMLHEPWKLTLTGKFFGGRLSIGFLIKALQFKWKLSAGLQLIPLAEGFFHFRFANEGDLMKVWNGGPWIVAGKILALERWKPDFVPADEAITKLNVWIRLSRLPSEYWNKNALMRIASKAGNPLGVDLQTEAVAKGNFARVCVQIDLSLPLVPGTNIGPPGKERWQSFAYEAIRDVCFLCGRVGHTRDGCMYKAGHNGVEGGGSGGASGSALTPYGPWLLVEVSGGVKPVTVLPDQQPGASATTEASPGNACGLNPAVGGVQSRPNHSGDIHTNSPDPIQFMKASGPSLMVCDSSSNSMAHQVRNEWTTVGKRHRNRKNK